MKIYKFRELVKKLKDHDKRFEVWNGRGKGSERMIYHPDINGRAESFPIKCHGEGDEVKKCYYPHMRKRFNLPDDFF